MKTQLLFQISHIYKLTLFSTPSRRFFHHSITQSRMIHSSPPGRVATGLIQCYCHKGLFNDARRVFDEIPNKDIVAWTAMITGYIICGRHTQAWTLFCDMKRKGEISVDAYPISSVLKACKGMMCSSCGAMVQGLAVKSGVDCNIYVENALMDMYATCNDNMEDACKVFQRMCSKNEVSWTTMIATYTHRGDGYAAIQLFRMMQQEKVEPNPFTFSIIIRAIASTASLAHGQQIHAAVLKHGFESNLPVGNSLADMYCRCSRLPEAYRHFLEMADRDLITWNTMISGSERSGSVQSLELFSQLRSEGLCPNCFTYTSVAAACANMAILNCGQQIHGLIVRSGLEGNLALANALINMYAKCGSISDSRRIFSGMAQRDVISWTSMMNGYGSHGYGIEAVELFDEMVRDGVKPDRLVFLGVIFACSHVGLIEEGLKYFHSMSTNYNIDANQEIYGCVVDLLGRAGRVIEAYELTMRMPFEADESVWGALLGACKAHKNLGLGRLAAQKILELRPKGAETYVMLSNICAANGDWGEFAKLRKLMRGNCDKKVAGQSWIELRDEVYNFVVGEKVGPDIELVYEKLDMLAQHMNDEGYVPDLNCLRNDFEAMALIGAEHG